MFFFFFGGIQPKIKQVLKSNYGACLNCRTGMMDHVEIAQTFYAFFLPVYSFAPEQVLHCETCGFTTTIDKYNNQLLHQSQKPRFSPLTTPGENPCRQCGSPVSDGWSFCPKCGREIS